MEEVMKYQKKAIEEIKRLSESRLKAALDFIEYLAEKEEWEATWEVLGDKDSVEKIGVADNAWKDRRMGEFFEWDNVRRNVQDPSGQ